MPPPVIVDAPSGVPLSVQTTVPPGVPLAAETTVARVTGCPTGEGFVEELKITETLFNADLDPVRAEIDVTLQEKIDSLSFAIGSIKRLGRMLGQTAVEDMRDVLL